MNGSEAIAAVASVAANTVDAGSAGQASLQPAQEAVFSFGDMIAQGLSSVETRIDHADEMVRAFTLDDNVPVHQVTIALEEARLAVELAMQVRTRLVEAYREIMNMQL